MEIPPQEAPPGPGADADADAEAEEAPAEAESPTRASPTADGRLKTAAKRVTFPSDEDIVSGAVEPKDPWRHAQNVTVDEVISAYRQACQKLNCRQIPKLLRQLQVWGLWALTEGVCGACVHVCVHIYVAQPWTQPSLPQPYPGPV